MKQENRQIRIIPHVENDVEYNGDNPHCNHVGTLFELRMDEVLTNGLKDALDENNTAVESDFEFEPYDDGDVKVMLCAFRAYNLNNLSDLLKNEDNLRVFEQVCRNCFGFENISLNYKDGYAYYQITDKSEMVSFIEALNNLGIDTTKTFTIEGF